MGNYILNLVLNSIKYQKKKYLLLCVGIIISVVLSNSILLIVKNAYNNQNENTIKAKGNYEIAFINSDKECAEKVKQDNDVDKENTSLLIIETENSIDRIKDLRCDLIHINDSTLRNILGQLKIKEGRLPENNHEIIMEEWVAKRNNLSIGDEINFNINNSDNIYKIVGYYQNFKSSQYKEKTNIYTILYDLDEREWKSDYILNVMFKLKDNVDFNKSCEKFKAMVPEDQFEINETVANKRSSIIEFNETLGISLVLIVPVMIVSIFMILNIFNISVSEKIKYFGMLKMLGASRKVIKKLVISEALIIGFMSFPPGVLISIILVKYVARIFDVEYIIGSEVNIYLECILISGIILAVIMFISAYFPAKHVSKITPLDAVFQNRSGITSSISSKSGKAIPKQQKNIILEMANKNIKRNKKKYNITILSIMLSVFLVIVYSCYFSMVSYVIDKQTKEEVMINTKIYKGQNTPNELFSKIYEDISNLNITKNIYNTYDTVPVTITSDLQQGSETALIQIYDSERLDSIKKSKYFIGGTYNIQDVKDNNGILVYCKNNDKESKVSYGSSMKIKNSDNNYMEFHVDGVFEYLPFNLKNEFEQAEDKYNVDNIIIMSRDSAEKLIKSEISLIGYDLIAKNNKDLDNYNDSIINVIDEIQDVKWVEYDDIRSDMNSMLSQINIAAVVFLSFIVFIAFLNLLNIINTSIIERKHEFGILKAIGMSEKKIRLMVYIEGFICTVKASIYGTLLSIIFVYGVKTVMLKSAEWTVPFKIYLFPIVFTIISSYLASLIPLRKVGKFNIVDLINDSEN